MSRGKPQRGASWSSKIQGLRHVVWSRRASRIPSTRDLWFIGAIVALGAGLYYADVELPFWDVDLPLRLTRRSVHRILFIIPVVYSGFVFGPRIGYLTLASVTILMLPGGLLISPAPVDAVLEILSVSLVCALVLLWFTSQQEERVHRQEILNHLESARQELASRLETIKKNDRRRAIISEICNIITCSLDLYGVIEQVLDKIMGEFGLEAALVFLRKGRTGQELELVAHRGVSDAFARSVATLETYGRAFRMTIETGKAVTVQEGPETDEPSPAGPLEDSTRFHLIMPLEANNAVVGLLCVAGPSTRAISTEDRDLLATVAAQVGIATENARLYQEALTSNEKYRDLFENATEAIFVQDLSGTITAANNACTELMGYPLDDLIGMNVSELFPAQTLKALATIQQGLLRGETALRHDFSLTRRDGAEFTLSMTTRLIHEDEQPTGFQHIAVDVTGQQRMRDTLNYYVQQVLTAQEEERKRIARELHDDTAQSLLLILQRMEFLTYLPDRELPGSVGRDVEELRAVVLQALGNLRRITRDLRPQILDDLGLAAAVEWLAEDVERQCGIRTSVDVIGSKRSLALETQLLMFRIVQEALSNVRRHSAASEARVTLEFLDDKIRVCVEDNGQGFEKPDSFTDLPRDGKLGILGMSERARLGGGSLSITSELGKGTRIEAELPG